MNELEKLMQRIRELEKIAERSADQTAELDKARARVSELEAERNDTNENMAAKLAEMERKEAIREAGEAYKADAEMIRAHLSDKTMTAQDLKDALLVARVEDATDVSVQVGGRNGKEEMERAIGDALSIRMGVEVKEPHADVDMFRGASMIDIAKAVTGVSSYNKEKIAERAMSTADFPNLLLSVGNRVLEQEFEAASGTYREFVTEVDVNDFRQNSDVTIGMGGRLDKYLENGELKQKTLGENAEKWSLNSYGNEFVLTRKMIVNDDLGAFSNMLALFGEMAGQTANGIVYDLLLARGDYASYTMSDGSPIFDAAHANTGNAALDAGTLAAARAAMRKHKSIDGVTPLNIVPAYLIVGPDNEQAAYELINSIASTESGANAGVANFHAGSMTVVVDAEIDGAKWYLSAARRAIKAGYLAGTGRQPSLKMNDSTLTKTVFEGIFDFGVVASDYRGLYRGKNS